MNDKIKESAILHKNLILSPFDEIISLDGFDAIQAFSHAFSGGSVYIPSLRSIFRQCIEQEICNRYNGKNIKSLAKDYGFSERHIHNLVQQTHRIHICNL